MMGRCETCKWWKPCSGYPREGWGKCRLTEARDDALQYPETKAYAWADWIAELITAPDFGCVQHELRETA